MSESRFHEGTCPPDGLRFSGELYGRGVSPRSLWITCTDPVMDPAIERIQRLGEVHIMRRPSLDWLAPEPENSGKRTFLYTFIQRLGVDEIVLCGHSGCSAPSCQVNDWESSNGSGMVSIVERVRRRQAQNDAARSELLRQLAALKTLPTVSDGLDRGDIAVFGVFYMVESHTFTRYDMALDRFVAVG